MEAIRGWDGGGAGRARLAGWCLLAACIWLACPAPAAAQLGNLLSPGRLAKAHANLEGLSNCQQCHEQGRRVTVAKCLACHKPVAERMSKRVGVHRDVKDTCVTCHAEHAGANGELRPFDQAGFDHARVTGFALDGKHDKLAAGCAACHKERSFLTARADCVACHADVHKPSLGARCQTCHSTRAAFKDIGSQFDHTKAAFQLTGAHKAVTCEKCHANQVFKGVAFSSCTSCHRDPHRQTFGAGCTTCHTSEAWRTRQIDHSKTAFALVGRHQKAECASCHRQPAMRVKPRADTCAACHVDVHRGAFKQDCKSCHNEASFDRAPFDHTQTKFTLTGKHEPLACEVCHKNVAGQDKVPAAKRVADFRGLSMACASCHADVHQAELGTTCETCHTSSSFKVAAFTHSTAPAFFGGQHAGLSCAQCHLPHGADRTLRPVPATVAAVRVSAPLPQPGRTGTPVALDIQYRAVPTSCVSCHRDVHLGQEGTACESCHTLAQPKFALPSFVHAKTAFALTGKHETTACALCHKPETAPFPAGRGTAVRYKGVGRECRSCHADIHLGQVDAKCETCHTTRAFAIEKYRHRNARTLAGFFVGDHATATCQACHKPATGPFPAGRGTAVRFKVDTTCVNCHTDVHRGALGADCGNCHRP